REFVLQNLDGVVIPDAHVAGVQRSERIHQPADARAVHLDSEVVVRGIVFRGPSQPFAVAETDFEYVRGLPSEQRPEVAWCAFVVDAEALPVLLERALLCRGDATLTQHETSNGAPMPGIGGFWD